MGAGDDLIAGMSTFLLELWNTSFILSKATQRSLVILVRLSGHWLEKDPPLLHSADFDQAER
jgi:hypothetical protein